MSQEAIALQDLSFRYPEAIVLENITLSIKHGEFVGIFGPNGGGKTTFLKLLMGLLKPSSGSVSLFGKSPKNAWSDIAYVPQNRAFDRQFPISVFDLVLSGLLSQLPWHGRYSSQQKERAAAAIEKVNLTPFSNRQFGKLSGGQMQRALLARALIAEPKLLLLDEPTANVDAKAERDIYDLLRGFAGSLTIVMVTHDLKAIIEEVERVICIQSHKAYPLAPNQVCEHFAMGLYHPPILPRGMDK